MYEYKWPWKALGKHYFLMWTSHNSRNNQSFAQIHAHKRKPSGLQCSVYCEKPSASASAVRKRGSSKMPKNRLLAFKQRQTGLLLKTATADRRQWR